MKLELTKPPYDLLSIVEIENFAESFLYNKKVYFYISIFYKTYKTEVSFRTNVGDYFVDFVKHQISKAIGMQYQYLIDNKVEFDKNNFDKNIIVEIEIV